MFSNQQLKESIKIKNIINVEPLRVLVNEVVYENEKINIGQIEKPDIMFSVWQKAWSNDEIKFTELDARVYNAIFTFVQYEVTEFSVEQLAGMLYGNFEQRHRKNILLAIKQSVEQMKKYQIEIQARNQFRKYPRLKGVDSEFKGAFLNIEIEEGRARNGKCTTIYRIRNPSPLMVYALTLGYVVKIDMDLYQALPTYISYAKLAMCEDLLHKISLANNPKNSMYKKEKNMLVFGWDKNKKQYAGIIGKHMDEIEERKIESMLKTLLNFWEKLKKTGSVSDFEIIQETHNYRTRQYKKIYFKRS